MTNKPKEKCSTPCNLCSSYNVEVLSLISRERKYLSTVICKGCGLVWTDPMPVKTKEYYEKEYRMEYKGSLEPKLKHIYRAGMVGLNRFGKIKNFLSTGAKILDVGSGGGEFVYLLNKLGYKTPGMEPNIGYAEYSKREYNLHIITGFVQDIELLKNDSYNMITLWHVLEHTENPFQVLYKLNSWLKNNGILIVEVPNVEAVCQAPANRFHIAHLFNFNSKTLEKMGNKAGFSLLEQKVSDDGGNIFMVFYKPEIPPVLEGLSIEGNYQRIIEIIRRHTNFRHFLSPFPYTRFFRKIGKIFNEKKAIKGFIRGKDVLDFYYNKYNA